MTMPIEATEHTGPIVIWRKEVRPGSGGDGEFRGGLGQVIEVAPRDGVPIEVGASFQRVSTPARGRHQVRFANIFCVNKYIWL